MNAGIWKFRPKNKSEKNLGFTLGEFFTSKDLEFPGKALVREVVQNSLDAKQDNENPVIVKFSLFKNSYSVTPPQFSLFLQGLDRHLNAVRSDMREIPATTSPMPILIIEDFNTRGLDGDPTDFMEHIVCEKPGKNNFYYFWRNWGISSKSDKDRGRWGLGKAVYPRSSMIRTFFGLTVRNSDKKQYLMGQSVIKQHSIDGITYDLFGDFGTFELSDEYFVLPVEGHDHLSNFRSAFHISRNGEPGLSIVIPWPLGDITANNLILAVIGQFFFPILSGNLIAEICENGRTTEINAETIFTAVDSADFSNPLIAKEKISREKMQSLLEFTAAALKIPEKSYLRINNPDLKKKPDWKSVVIDEKTLDDLVTKYETGEIISFDISVKARLNGETDGKGQFRVFIQNDEELLNPEYYFIREGLIIGKAGTFSARGIRALVIIDNAPLTNLLGDAENPSHTEWRQNSDKFQGKYEHGPSTLSFVKYSLTELAGRLNRKRIIVEPDLLVDFFSVVPEKDEHEAKPRKPMKKPGKTINPEKIVLPKPKPALVKIEEIDGGGVKISRNKASVDRAEKILLEFAYDIEGNNPFTKYSPWDFDLGSNDMKIESSGIQNIEKSGNNLHFEITSDEFEIKVLGFDPRRDVKVAVVKEAADAQ